MATRKGLGYTSPSSPMTPKGGSGMLYDNTDPQTMSGMPMESPDTFRRRTTPLTDAPPPQQNALQELLAMLTEGR